MARSEEGAGRVQAARPVARVVTAGEMSSKLREDTVAKLRNLVSPDVRVEFEVDPAIIGGMMVHLPDRVIDMSMAGRFRSYGRAVQELIDTHLGILEGWARSEEQPALDQMPVATLEKE